MNYHLYSSHFQIIVGKKPVTESCIFFFFFTIITISIALICLAILFHNAVMLLRLPKASMTQKVTNSYLWEKQRDLGIKRPEFTIIVIN